ncbi:WD repeat domain phosphoinositide-interacting protein 2 isoform X1 [Anopheles gambiae]|uniref:WD repeat domain phosphoinositide-interacting protein 2-like isoform X1 n=1 Tax=Anopheles coluzzii TaxID=1518534 RepID=UPI0020FF9975|nr:WD repeat domain phosphoinositide-interacting protein 2-like isoform X1 [Anopheles coluzzii]XP_061516808.1 WD repeat domain phosphoinositide-interacting protein 2 isoform X1 [Anopheles gambiae]
MSDISQKCFGKNGGFSISFNQDYTSLSVVSRTGYRLFSLTSVDRVDEIFCSHDEDTKIAERLFSSSLVAVVTASEPNKLKVCHFKKGAEICNYGYPSEILSVKLNRSRLVVCLVDSIYIHNIRDMRLLHSIKNMAPNPSGLCTLSLLSHLAYPVATDCGELQIFDAANQLRRLKLKAHDSPLSALNFSYNGLLLATASEKGTVIRVFCVKNGQRVHEFRRGVKRHVSIGSLYFSTCASFVVASSNTETVHIFRIDPKAIEQAERRQSVAIDAAAAAATSTGSSSDDDETQGGSDPAGAAAAGGWGMGFLAKAVTSYLPTNVVTDVFTQDRAYATIQLAEPGLRYECVMAKLEKETRLLLACEDGFLYIYSFEDSKGGECKLIRAHDLRTPLHGITEVDIVGNENDENTNSLNVNMTKSMLPAPGTYAGVLKGRPADRMSADSDWCHDLREAVEYPVKVTVPIYDEMQFPPVTPITVE